MSYLLMVAIVLETVWPIISNLVTTKIIIPYIAELGQLASR